jgi:hypothetical protein
MRRGICHSSSAVYVAFGTPAVIAGGIMTPIGTIMNATEVVTTYGEAKHPGMMLLVWGVMLLVLGALALVIGLYNLAAGVDYLVANAPADAPKEDAPTEAS